MSLELSIWPASLLYACLVDRKHLRDNSDSFAGALAEQDAHSRTHVLRVADELEHHRSTIVCAQSLAAHNAPNDGRLANAAYVDCGLEADIDGRGVEQHGHLGLQREVDVFIW